MPFALSIIGLILLVSGVRNTTGELSQQIAKDFSGSDSFLYWLAGLGAVGALGYVDALKTFSRLLLALIIVVMALHNGGFFAKFQEAIANAQAPAPATTNPATGTTTPGTSAAPASTAHQSLIEQALGLPAGSIAPGFLSPGPVQNALESLGGTN